MWRPAKEPSCPEIAVKYLDEGKVAVVSFNRAKKYNAINLAMFDALRETMEWLGRSGSTVRAIVFNGIGKNFTAGIDLQSAMTMQELKADGADRDPARAGFDYMLVARPLQASVSSLEKVRVPVICAIHGLCIGAGVDLAAAADVRICSADAKFSIREVDIGLAADVGTLQRFQKVVGNDSWTRELAYTARFFGAQEAATHGFVGKVADSAESCFAEAIKLATFIAQKSPVAVATTKMSLVYSRDHSVQEGLDHIALANAAMLQTDDMAKAAAATMSKQPGVFPKL